MDRLYDRLLELLHQKPRSRLVHKFLREIPEAPTIEKFGSIRSYHFPRHGFRFDSDLSFGYIWWICLYFEHANGWEVFYQDYQPFSGELPSQIQRDDQRDSILKKLDCAPALSHQEPAPAKVPDVSDEDLQKWTRERAKDPMITNHDTYHIRPFSLHFAFCISGGQLVRMCISKDRDEGSFERKMRVLRKAGFEC